MMRPVITMLPSYKEPLFDELEEGMQVIVHTDEMEPCFKRDDIITIQKVDDSYLRHNMCGLITICRSDRWHPIESHLYTCDDGEVRMLCCEKVLN
jgi:hypothetical protein